jgi:hypothetical protein
LNEDDKVDFADILIVIKWLFNIERTNNAADVNGDGEVNIFDVVIVSRLLGKQYGNDTTEPGIISHRPSATILPLGTTSVVVGVEVNEKAVCRYTNVSGGNFTTNMTLFERTGGIFNSYNATGLQNNQSYSYYIQCRDEAGNLNSTDYYFNFSVGTAEDSTAPISSITAPTANQVLISGTTQTTLGATTNEAATCKWATTDVAYSSMPNTFSTTGNTIHSTTLTGLSDGQSYTRYVRCADSAGNSMTSSQSVSFSVAVGGEPICETTGGNCYYVSTNGNDANPGTFALPFRTTLKGLQTTQNGDILYIRGGTYRLPEEQTTSVTFSRSGATPTSFVTIRNYPGENPIILGGWDTSGKTWDQYNSNVWRTNASFLTRDPAGMHEASAGRRVDHVLQFIGGTREHGNVSQLTQENTWTKADVNGIGDKINCGKNNNINCYIYIYPPAGENPNNVLYEFSQRQFFNSAGTSYLVVKGLTLYYNEETAIYLTNGNYQVIENNTVGHTSYSRDNSYSLRLWGVGGAIVRNNTIFDSIYWGGVGNSHAITFMITPENNPSTVEYNTIINPRGECVGSKGGVSNLIVRYNTLLQCDIGMRTPGKRCTDATDCPVGDPAYRPGGSWKIYGNIIKDGDKGIVFEYSEANNDNNTAYNNIFINNTEGVRLRWTVGTNPPPMNTTVVNNIFIDNYKAFFLANPNADKKTVNDFLPIYSSDYNLYYNNQYDYYLKPDYSASAAAEVGYTLLQMQTQFNEELNSLSSNPLFVETTNYTLQGGSPAIGAGNATIWNVDTVDIGRWPNPR